MSTTSAGGQATGPAFFRGSFQPEISGDGRFVTFHSDANNLVAGDTNDSTDVFVFDRTTSTIERVSVANDGSEATAGRSDSPDISDDGRFVTFQSAATNLVASDTNGVTDIFVRDRVNGSTTRLNVTANGAEANENGFEPLISGNGDFVGYTSNASNLAPDTVDTFDIFFADRPSGAIDFTTAAPESSINATQVTVVGTSGAAFAVDGNVDIFDSLLVNEVLNFNDGFGPTVEAFNVIENSDSGSDLFTPLTRQGFAPPVHFPLRGNPVIDAGDPGFVGTVDQRGTTRVTPDIGAVEAVDAIVSGQVYVDLNENQQRDAGEPIVSGVSIQLDTATTTQTTVTGDAGEFGFDSVEVGSDLVSITPPPNFSVSKADIQLVPNNITTDGQTDDAVFSFDGRFIAFTSGATNLVPNDTNNSDDVFVLDRSTNTAERVNVASDGSQAMHAGFIASSAPSISSDGRFVAFESSAENLVPDVGSFQGDVFVHDRETNTTEQISEADDGTPGNFQSREASISGDGRFVAFSSDANNLVGGDTGNNTDIFVRDRQTNTMQLISRSSAGTQANGSSGSPEISADGRFVTFTSSANNLVAGDTNGARDVFVRDLVNDTIFRINVGFDGSEANGSVGFQSAISGDGRWIAFSSGADNIVPNDTNGVTDTFVFDTVSGTTERVSLSSNGSEGNNGSRASLAISDDGRFVAFNSEASNLVPGDTNGFEDLFVYDRETDQIARMNVTKDGLQPSDFSPDPFPLGFVEGTISPNGHFIAFDSEAADLTGNDTNGLMDTFLASNPFFDASARTIELQAGDVANNLDFGLIADSGNISGRLFEDSAILNQVYDIGETVLPERLVFIDANGNGAFDRDEQSTLTDVDGIYRFVDLPAHRDYSIRAAITPGDEQVVPGADEGLAFNFFLEAGASVGELNFGFRPVSTTGQSSDSVIQGRVQSDTNGNGVQDASDAPVVGQIVYLDGGTLGVRDFDDPQTVTDAQGNYSFAGLASTLTPVRLALDNQVVQVAPLGNVLLGNDSQPLKFPLDERERRGGNPQSVVTADFNLDGFEDVAVVLAETNTLSIRLNDTLGGFTDEKFDFILSEFAADQGSLFAAPNAVVASQFDNDSRIDVAVVGNFTGNVFVLSNFDHNTASFLSTTLVPVGDEPIDIIAGQFGGDSVLDLVVLNKGDETVQVLTNDGAGVFTAGVPVVTGGQEPVSLSTANFTGGADLDVAVTHAFPLDTSTTVGGVTMLVGDGNGGLTRDGSYYPVQSTPFDSDVGDFNGDGRPDLAVVNFSSNSISILIGQADGTLLVQDETLGTVNGSVNVATADIDNDGDVDVITTKLNQRQVSIFRNITQPGAAEAVFEPQENVGLGQFSFSEQVPFAIANLDNDQSGPAGNGTLDIVAVPQNSDTLFVLPNQLVQGSRRVSVSGASTDIADNIDFLIAPATLAPSFDLPALPTPVVEDATQQTVLITNVLKGRASSNSTLRFIATSSNPALVPDPTISFVDGDSTASLQYTPVANGNGQAVITDRAEDAGADGVFGGDDDGILERSFTVTVLPVNDPPTFVVPASTQVTEGASPTTIDNFVTGISTGGGGDESGQTLNPFVVTTDSSFFTTPPAINASGQLTFAIAPDATGSVTVNVSLSDNGGIENGGHQQTDSFFVINIAPESPDSIILQGDGNTFVFTEAGPQLDGVQLIDIRGTGDNTLMLDVARIRELFQNGSITVISDAGDEVVFDDGWEFVEAVLSNGQLVRRFEQLGAAINLMGPDDFTNPISEFDVNASGDVSALDALVIINELAGRQFSDGGTSPEGGVRDPGSIDLSGFRFYDVTRDQRITAL
ncbi:MAG: SdrD B-like domain-containing protein, partial [Rubripirellula sp.]